MKRLLSSFSLALMVSGSAFALAPSRCPSAEALAAVGVNDAVETIGWLGLNWSNYFDTDNEWSLLVWVDVAKNKADAIKKANRVLKKLNNSGGPEREGDSWFCAYKNKKNNALVAAYTPKIKVVNPSRFIGK
ncbi:DUF4949 domain-containing protein [Legionella dresdenensis]|uniref:DUF4949 domain-containing protein n=1 Tax=Legionella dresdenensis TaxID=450200 RepID=A0ABV8CB78_9GAMM